MPTSNPTRLKDTDSNEQTPARCPRCGDPIDGIRAFAEAGTRSHCFDPCGHEVPSDFALTAPTGELHA